MIQLEGDAQKALYDGLFGMAACELWEWDPQTQEFRANDRWQNGHPDGLPDRLCLEELMEHLFPEQPQDAVQLRSLLRGKETQCVITPTAATGLAGGKACRFFVLRDPQGQPIRLLCATVSQPDKTACSYDTLTRLPDRDAMLARIARMSRKSFGAFAQYAFFIIDINNFRQVNNSYGYSTGDLVIRELARRLETMRSDRVFVSRGESNNFFALLSGMAGSEEIEWMLKKLAACFEEPFRVGGQREIRLTASIGAVGFYKGSGGTEYVLNSAYTALKRAKEHSSFSNNCAVFNRSMLVDLQQKEQIIEALEHHPSNGCLSLHYQPQIHTHDGSLHAFEALLRLGGLEMGRVPPDKFIPIAEETGQIIEIGYWVLRESCGMVRRLLDAGVRFSTVAVNISSVQLMAEDFTGQVRRIIEESGIPPSMLEFEITESLLMHSVDYGASVLRELKKFGVGVALDDFGMQYSSLNYIRALSIDTLKIDKVFIDTICSDEKSRSIVEMIVNMARQLGLEVIAEGVETPTQLAELRRVQCPIVQGFFYSEPMPANEILQKYLPRLPQQWD